MPGARPRQIIAAWQKGRGARDTGDPTPEAFAALPPRAAPAIARFDDEQREADKRNAREEAKPTAVAEARRRQDRQEKEARRCSQPPAGSAQAAPGPPRFRTGQRPGGQIAQQPAVRTAPRLSARKALRSPSSATTQAGRAVAARRSACDVTAQRVSADMIAVQASPAY
jgi:hypothetical protein